MKTLWKYLFLLSLTVVVTGCASGTKYSEFQQSAPKLTPERGRVYFYRTSCLGAAVQPNIFLNGRNVGKAVPQGFFYVDSEPGEYKVTTATEVERTLSFTLDKGQTRYVRMNISMGFLVGHVYGELVEEAKATAEIKDCSYCGPPANQTTAMLTK